MSYRNSNDVRALVGDDNALESGILPALEQYNVEQFVVASLPDNQQVRLEPLSIAPLSLANACFYSIAPPNMRNRCSRII